jgi:cobalt-zinc-cadmium efflux system outer membrane protein
MVRIRTLDLVAGVCLSVVAIGSMCPCRGQGADSYLPSIQPAQPTLGTPQSLSAAHKAGYLPPHTIILGGTPPRPVTPPPEVLPEPKAQATSIQPGVLLADLIQLALSTNPSLQQAGLDVNAAQGKALQAGLYPNPILSGTFDELGDVQGPSGINTFPQLTQEFVTAGKLKLARAAALRQTDIAALDLVRKRMELITAVRKRFIAVLALQRRLEILEDLVKLANDAVDTAERKLKAKQISELDVLQFRVEQNRLAAKLEATRREQVAAWRQLAAIVGIPKMPPSAVFGTLEADIPELDYETTRALVLNRHPSVQAAEAGIARAELELKRAQVQAVPNVTLSAGYVRQNQNKSDDWMLSFSLPLPVFDRNQGNVQTARAELARSFQEVHRVENELSRQLAEAYGQYAAYQKQVERYRTGILKDANRAYELSFKGFEAGQFEYLKVLAAQQARAQANLEYIQILEGAWSAGADIAGLLLDEHWPAPPPTVPPPPPLK